MFQVIFLLIVASCEGYITPWRFSKSFINVSSEKKKSRIGTSLPVIHIYLIEHNLHQDTFTIKDMYKTFGSVDADSGREDLPSHSCLEMKAIFICFSLRCYLNEGNRRTIYNLAAESHTTGANIIFSNYVKVWEWHVICSNDL